jgi:cytochrome c biogenesis protein CcmG/thiol:disulfide interchange protein DsbE
VTDLTSGPSVEPERQGGRHLARNAAIAVAIVIVALVALLATRKTASDQPLSSSVVGKAVPSLSGQTLAGQHYDVDGHLGQWTVVDFFGSWCTPCLAEQGELVKFAKAHRDDVSMVGVMYQDKPADAQRFYKSTGANWPILDDKGPTAISFGVSGVPETYVVDPDGRVVAKFEAGVTAKALEGVLARYGGTTTSTAAGAP